MSVVSEFFIADYWRITIVILDIIAIILFLFVIGKTLSKPRKIKLMYIVMINVMITAIINSIGFLLNWVVDHKLLFGDENGFVCQSQAFILFFTHTSRETFVTLISIISFISFKFGDSFSINHKKLSIIIALLIGYLIPLIADIIYLKLKVFGQSHLICFTRREDEPKSNICGIIHSIYILFLGIISLILISYLVIKTTNCNKKQDNDSWINDDEEKQCMNPNLKKIIFFPLAQICMNIISVIYRISESIKGHDNAIFRVFARMTGILSSVTSILYILIFAITNGIFTNIEKSTKNEIKSSESLEIEMNGN